MKFPIFYRSLALAVLVFPAGRALGDTIWGGAVNRNWSVLANWTNGLPTASNPVFFGTSSNYAVDLNNPSDNLNVRYINIRASAGAYVFGDDNAQDLLFNNASQVTVEHGVDQAQTFNANLRMAGTVAISGNLVLRNDAIAHGAELIVNGNLGMASTSSNTTLRSINLSGLGGGAINGNIVDGGTVSALNTISGGGTWTLTGSNTYTGTGSTTSGGAGFVGVRGGATLILDYTENNTAKFNSAQQLQITGGHLEILGHDDANTTVTFNGLSFTSGRNVDPGESFGTLSSLHAQAGEDASLTLNLGVIGGISSNPSRTLLRVSTQGDVVINATSNNAESYLIYNKDFGVITSGVLGARSDYIAPPETSGSSTAYYSFSGTGTNAGTGTTLAFAGFKLNTTAVGQSYTTTKFLNGNTLLFVGAHDYVIHAGRFGNAGANALHLVNVGSGALTLDGALRGSIFKSGEGKVIAGKAAELNELSMVSVGEGIFSITATNVFGPSGNNANTVSTQAGATVSLVGGLTLPSHTTFQLHGLGYEQAGALRNESGNNVIGGDVILGMTSKISSDAGTLTIGGKINAYSSTTGANTALIFDGAGTTVVNGAIGGVQGFGYGLTKNGTGTLTLNGTNAYTTNTLVSKGTLMVGSAGSLASSKVTVQNGATFTYNNNTTAYAGSVVLESGSKLGGSGRFASTLSGAGQIGPGNSPGIMTADAVDFSSGLDFAFELTAAGSPVWSNNLASGNDVLRLTAGSTPFVGTASAANVFSIYFTSGNTTYRGGLFTDRNANFSASISSATFTYYIWNGSAYEALDSSYVTRSVTQIGSANFSDGTITNGWTMEFAVAATAVPEPSTWMLVSLLGATGVILRTRVLSRKRVQA